MGARVAAVLAAIVTALACLPIGGAAGWWWGHGQGVQQQRGEQAVQTVEALTGLVDANKGLVDQANQASAAIRTAVAARQAADQQTTRTLKDALQQTAATRAGCVYGDGVMRQLATARDRAAQAAAGGTGGGVPTTGRDASGQP